MEIERKFLIPVLPVDIESWPHRDIEQGYICQDPVLRIRHSGEKYSFVYKSGGLLAHQEESFPLTEEAYKHLSEKIDGKMIKKRRYVKEIENGLKIELDVFENVFEPDGSRLQLAEVEFPSIEAANVYNPPAWFGKDVTLDPAYHNNTMAMADDVQGDGARYDAANGRGTYSHDSSGSNAGIQNATNYNTDNNSAAGTDTDNDGVNKNLLRFLDTDDMSEKYKILDEMRSEIDDNLIDNMAASLDFVIPDGPLDDRYEHLKYAVRTRSRFENDRLR